MKPARFSLSLLGAVGLLVAALAAAAIWLSITQPVTTASSVEAATQGDVSPLVNALAGVLYDALRGIMKYL